MSEEKGRSVQRELDDREIMDSLSLIRKERDRGDVEHEGGEGHLNFRQDIRDDLTNANIHYGNRDEGSFLGSRKGGAPREDAADHTSENLGSLNGTVANGVVH